MKTGALARGIRPGKGPAQAGARSPSVPPSAVLIGRDGPYIYILDKEKKAVVVNVDVLTRREEYIAIASPKLHAGDTVIVDGQINVAPGILVTEVAAKRP